VFFLLSKTLDALAMPLVWAMLFAAFGAWANRRRRSRLAFAGPAAAFAVLYAFAIEPVANTLGRSLEASAVRTTSPDVTYDAVVVLGGLVDGRASASSGTPAYGDGVERLMAAYDLLRTGRARYALLSGGRLSPFDKTDVEADILERQLEDWGIASERLVVEGESRNTRENAAYAARIVKEKGWTRLALITSAFHMERAAGCFRAVGVPFDSLPVDFRTYDPRKFSGSWFPHAEALVMSTMAIREYIGRAVYSLCGYSAPWP
jgi:uncharacterized SAM-binding protein YcdF (DUF218 family)